MVNLAPVSASWTENIIVSVAFHTIQITKLEDGGAMVEVTGQDALMRMKV